MSVIGLKIVNVLNHITDNTNNIKPIITKFLVDSGLPCIYAGFKIYDYMISSFIMSEWTDSFILNNKEYQIYNIAQAIVDVNREQ